MTTVLSIQIPDDVSLRLETLVEKTGREKSFYVTEAMSQYLDELEDGQHALSVLERIRNGEEKVLTSKEFWNGLAH